MRLQVIIDGNGQVKLPWDYQVYLRKFIYKCLRVSDKQFAKNMHDNGITIHDRHYKPFTFSKIYSNKRNPQEDYIIMSMPAKLYISSYFSDFINTFLDGFFNLPPKEQTIKILDTHLQIIGLEVIPEILPDSQPLTMETMSPIVLSSIGVGNKKHKKFLSPDHGRYSEIVSIELYNKFIAFGLFNDIEKIKTTSIRDLAKEIKSNPYLLKYEHRKELEEKMLKAGAVTIKPISDYKKKMLTIKSTNVIGYEYQFTIEGPRDLIEIAYKAGIGERTGQGFGMLRVIE